MHDELDLLRGTLDVLVLKPLIFGPRHGYDVARWIFETSRESLRVDDGALYTALHRMENRGWLEACRRRRRVVNPFARSATWTTFGAKWNA